MANLGGYDNSNNNDEGFNYLEYEDGTYSHTPLQTACSEGFSKIVDILIAYGANIEAGDFDDDKPLYLALANGHVDIALKLIANGARTDLQPENDTLLHLAAYYGSEEMVNILLTNGVDVDERDIEGDTPLYHAVMGNHIKIAETLIEAGADVDGIGSEYIGEQRSTILDIAIEYGNNEMIRLLRNSGAKTSTELDAAERMEEEEEEEMEEED